MKKILIAFTGVIAATIAACPAAQAARDKSCAAVTLRGMPPGLPVGQSAEAGLYKARFGAVSVEGTRKTADTNDYVIALKNDPLEPVSVLPKGVAPCLKEKHVPIPPVAKAQPCAGEKLKLIIVPEGEKRVLVLYAGEPGKWNYCRNSIVGE